MSSVVLQPEEFVLVGEQSIPAIAAALILTGIMDVATAEAVADGDVPAGMRVGIIVFREVIAVLRLMIGSGVCTLHSFEESQEPGEDISSARTQSVEV